MHLATIAMNAHRINACLTEELKFWQIESGAAPRNVGMQDLYRAFSGARIEGIAGTNPFRPS